MEPLKPNECKDCGRDISKPPGDWYGRCDECFDALKESPDPLPGILQMQDIPQDIAKIVNDNFDKLIDGKPDSSEKPDSLVIFKKHAKMSWDHEWVEDHGVLNYTEFHKIYSPLQSELTRLREENENFKTVMIAAAEEIQRHWQSHCDENGYGPANLMHRLEKGIPSKYGYTAGAFDNLKKFNEELKSNLNEIDRLEISKLREENERLQKANDYDERVHESKLEHYEKLHNRLQGENDRLSKELNELKDWKAQRNHFNKK